MDNEYNFKIGDYIRINNLLKDMNWYTNEVYQITNIIYDVLILDRNLPYAKENTYHNRLHASKAVLDVRKIRFEKIMSILND